MLSGIVTSKKSVKDQLLTLYLKFNYRFSFWKSNKKFVDENDSSLKNQKNNNNKKALVAPDRS